MHIINTVVSMKASRKIVEAMKYIGSIVSNGDYE